MSWSELIKKYYYKAALKITDKNKYRNKLARNLYNEGEFQKAREVAFSLFQKNQQNSAALLLIAKSTVSEKNSLFVLKNWDQIEIKDSSQQLNEKHKKQIENFFTGDLLRYLSYYIDRKLPVRKIQRDDFNYNEWYQFVKTFGNEIKALKWEDDPDLAKIAHFIFSADIEVAISTYDKYLIEKSVEYGYLNWPKKIQQYIKGKKVIDVGCGFGAFGNAFLVAGAKSYTGVDPAMDIDSKKAKNKRIRQWDEIELTPNEIQRYYDPIKLVQGKFEDFLEKEKFDVVSLHNVTEHLLEIEKVLKGILELMHDDSFLVANHHNYYCWNGHHLQPGKIEEYNEKNSMHRMVVDWNHVVNIEKIPRDNYVFTGLNRITLTELKEILAKYYDILKWDEIEQPEEWTERLSDEIKDKALSIHKGFRLKDFTTKAVFLVCKKKSNGI